MATLIHIVRLTISVATYDFDPVLEIQSAGLPRIKEKCNFGNYKNYRVKAFKFLITSF